MNEQSKGYSDGMTSGHGARPVSIALTRGGELRPQEASETFGVATRAVASPAPTGVLGGWPLGQQWVVTSLSGGVGRTTVARALAHLAGTVEGSTLLVGTERQQHGGWAELCEAQATGRQLATALRQGLASVPPIPGTRVRSVAACSPNEAPLPAGQYKTLVAPLLVGASQTIIDAEPGPLVELPDLDGPGSLEPVVGGRPWWNTPSTMWVFVTPTDQASIRRLNHCLDALTGGGMPMGRLAVVLNEHHGKLTLTSRHLRATLEARCGLVTQVPSDKHLAARSLRVDALHPRTRQGLTPCLTAAAVTEPAPPRRDHR